MHPGSELSPTPDGRVRREKVLVKRISTHETRDGKTKYWRFWFSGTAGGYALLSDRLGKPQLERDAGAFLAVLRRKSRGDWIVCNPLLRIQIVMGRSGWLVAGIAGYQDLLNEPKQRRLM